MPTFSEAFEAELMQAIVRQFFENPPLYGTGPNSESIHIPARPTPVQHVAAKLLADRNQELLAKIVEKIDLDAVAEDVAVKVAAVLTAPRAQPGYYGQPQIDQKIRDDLRERVDTRLVELLAQDLHAKMKAADLASEAD